MYHAPAVEHDRVARELESGCTGSATTSAGNAICQQFTSCRDNTTVMLCTNPSAQHLAAYGSATAKVAATAWNVFKTQSLP